MGILEVRVREGSPRTVLGGLLWRGPTSTAKFYFHTCPIFVHQRN